MGVPSAAKPLRIEQANAIGSREPARDADLELGGLTVEAPGAQALARQFDGSRILASTRLGG